MKKMFCSLACLAILAMPLCAGFQASADAGPLRRAAKVAGRVVTAPVRFVRNRAGNDASAGNSACNSCN